MSEDTKAAALAHGARDWAAADAFAEGWGEFAKARAEFSAVTLDKVNPHFKSKYASLASVLGAVTPALTAHGIVATTRTLCDGDTLVAETQLVYKGVVLISATMPIGKAVGVSAQAVGSALTYARRYTLCALLGVVAEEDDDGNAASASAAKDAAKDAAPF